MNLKEKKLIIFDCDGVLFDSYEANRAFYNEIARVAGRGGIDDEEMSFCHMHTAKESIEYLFRNQPDLMERAFKVYESLDYGDFLKYMTMEPGVNECIKRLKKRFLTAISTNRSTTMPKLIKIYELDKLFDQIVCALDVKRPKPDLEGIHLIVKRLGVNLKDSVYVGDSKVDEEVAKRAGIPLIAYKNSDLNTMFHVESFWELESLFA